MIPGVSLSLQHDLADVHLKLCLRLCLFQGGGGAAATGPGVGAVGRTLPSCGVLPEGEGRLQQRPDGEVLDEGTASLYCLRKK